jgi:hypothetical protein
MAPEEFRIKITKSGEVWIDMRGLGEHRVRELRQMLEEIVGPALDRLSVPNDRPGGTAVRIVTDQGEEHDRLRGQT